MVSEETEQPKALWGTSPLGPAIRIDAGGAQPAQPLSLSFDVNSLQANDPELIFFARWDPDSATWIALDSTYDPDSAMIQVEIDHLSLFAPFEWVGGQIIDGVNWTGRQLKQFHDSALAGVRSTRDTLVEGADLLGTNVAGWLGLRGASPPDCGSTEAIALESWELVNSADGDQPPLFGCVKAEAGSDEVTLHVANNRPYGMLVAIPPGSTVDLVSWPGASLDSGNAGLYALYEMLGENTGLGERYLPPQATIALTVDATDLNQILIDTRSNPAYAGLDLAVDLVRSVWNVEPEPAIDVANCLLDGASSLTEVMEQYDISNTLAYYDSFIACARLVAEDAIGDVFDLSKSLVSTLGAAISSFKDIGLEGISNSLTLVRRQVDPIAAVGCQAQCVHTEVEIEHPTWGAVTVLTYLREDGTGGIAAVDIVGNVRWEAPVGPDSALDRLGFAGDYQPTYPDTPRGVSGPIDALGHIFIDYNPGRFNGVVVLQPTADGFDDFGSLAFFADSTGGFYYAEVTDTQSDGTYEIQAYIQDCTPSCAEGLDYSDTWAWVDSSYVVVATTAPPPQPTPTDDCGSGDDELVIATCVATAFGDAVSDLDRQAATMLAPSLTDIDWSFFEFGVSPPLVNCVGGDAPGSVSCIVNFGGINDWCVSVDLASRTIWKQEYCGGG